MVATSQKNIYSLQKHRTGKCRRRGPKEEKTAQSEIITAVVCHGEHGCLLPWQTICIPQVPRSVQAAGRTLIRESLIRGGQHEGPSIGHCTWDCNQWRLNKSPEPLGPEAGWDFIMWGWRQGEVRSGAKRSTGGDPPQCLTQSRRDQTPRKKWPSPLQTHTKSLVTIRNQSAFFAVSSPVFPSYDACCILSVKSHKFIIIKFQIWSTNKSTKWLI